MTTDQPRIGDAAPVDGSDREVAGSAGPSPAESAGLPPKQAESAEPPVKSAESAAGSAGPAAPAGLPSTGATPGGPAGSGPSEWERAQAGLADTKVLDRETDQPDTGKGGRRWFRRKGGKAAPARAGGAGADKPAAAQAAAGAAATAGATTTAKPDAAKPDAATPGAAAAGTAAAGTAGGAAVTAGGADADGKASGATVTEAPPGKGRKRRKQLPTERPAGAPPDPWTAFATTPERAPGRIRRAVRAVGRSFRHEYALVTYAGILLAVALTWPTLRYPMHTVPQDVWDPSRQAWQIAWAGHILLTEPAQLWQSNAFYPERYSFAFGDSLLGYAPAGMLGDGPAAAILRYNILFVLAHALLVIGGYALVRQLGAKKTGAAVAAVAFAYAPWRLAQEGHLDIVSAGAIPLALAMLARGHGWSMRYGLRPTHRHAGWAAAGWLVAAWQISLGFSLGLPFAYVLGGVLLVIIVGVPIRKWRRKSPGPVLGWRLMVTDALGVVILGGIGALIALPYFRVAGTGPSTREIDFFSPPLQGLLIGPAESRIWGAPHAVPRSSLAWPAEMALLPGFVLYALALAGLVFSVWTLWQRLFLVLGLAAAVILTLGTTFFEGRWTYLPLFGHLPGSFGVRIPGRMMLWVTLLLAILAAGAVAELVRRAEHMSAQRLPPWPGPWLRLATFVPLMLVLVEAWNATPHPLVPAQPAAMRTVTTPTLVLPTTALADQTVMLWSTSRFQPIANGAGGFGATQQAELRQAVATFPDAASVQYLREAGVETVLLLRAQVAGTPWERSGDVPVDALQIRREDLDENTVLFRLS